MPYSLVDMCLYFFLYSFCGWLMETVLCSVQERRFVNRGFLNGPLCPIYGSGILLMLIFLIPVRDSVDNWFQALAVVFLAGAALASAVEYVTSWAMEKLFHARWWDYSHIKYNVNGRICLSISVCWGGLATAFLYIVQPQFERLVSWLADVNGALPAILAATLSGLFLVDGIISVKVARRIGNKLEQLDKWMNMIGEFVESLELPTVDDILQKVESVYDRLAPPTKRQRSEREEKLIHDGRLLSLEALRVHMSEVIAELRVKRDELMSATRPLQRRMLSAFPRLKWNEKSGEPGKHGGKWASLQEWKEKIFKSHE